MPKLEFGIHKQSFIELPVYSVGYRQPVAAVAL